MCELTQGTWRPTNNATLFGGPIGKRTEQAYDLLALLMKWGKRVDAGQRCKRRRHMLAQLIPKKIQPVVEKKFNLRLKLQASSFKLQAASNA